MIPPPGNGQYAKTRLPAILGIDVVQRNAFWLQTDILEAGYDVGLRVQSGHSRRRQECPVLADCIEKVRWPYWLVTLHDGRRAWKSFDWDTMARLHGKGMIEDPVNRSKSVVLTDDGLRRAEELFRALFTRSA